MNKKNKNRVIMFTQPKSGTWMFVPILKHFGLEFSGFDIRPLNTIDHRNLTPVQQRDRSWKKNKISMKMDRAFNMVKPGHFAISHLAPKDVTVNLNDWKIIFTTRELRHALISHMRWRKNVYGDHIPNNEDATYINLPDGPEKLLKYLNIKDKLGGSHYLRQVKEKSLWLKYDNVHQLKFEDFTSILSIFSTSCNNLASFLEMPVIDPLLPYGEICKPSMTYTGKMSTLDEFWSEEAEKWFCESFGPRLNVQLGYPANI